jgi:UDP-N-acetylglucosamine 2-epimerase
MRVLVVVGTRPEAIKLAPLVLALQDDPAFAVTTCLTSQHREMVPRMMSFFGVPWALDLQAMTPGQTLAGLAARVLEGVAAGLARDRHDLVVVQGDTGTALAAGLAAFYAGVPLAHVEAGLRSGDLARPFPEEGNRRLLDAVSAWLFAPTPGAGARLRAEGQADDRVFVTGNTGIDALRLARRRLGDAPPPLPTPLRPGERLALVTAHRRESFGPGLERICRALLTLIDRHPGLRVLFPVHPNPSVSGTVRAALGGHGRVHLAPPLDYPDFVAAMTAADLILTDSGGVQEEAPALGKRVLVLRDTTERPEGVAAGAAELVGTDEAVIVARASAWLAAGGSAPAAASPYGDGRACERIVEALKTGRLARPFGAPAAGREAA